MMEHNYRRLKDYKSCVVVLTLILVILVSFPALSWSGSKRQNRNDRFQGEHTYDQNIRQRYGAGLTLPDRRWSYTPSNMRGTYPLLSKNYHKRYDRLTPEEKTQLKRRYQEWESLPEEKQQMLRRRMERYEQLPPQERERFQERYRQLKKLPPDERSMIREKLRKWDNLTPQEQDQIRQRFRRP